MGLDLLIPIIVVAVVVAKVSKEFSKVGRNRPAGGGTGGVSPSAEGGEGAKSIAEFLEDLKRQAQAAQDEPVLHPEVAPPDADLQARLREKVREAARRKHVEQTGAPSSQNERRDRPAAATVPHRAPPAVPPTATAPRRAAPAVSSSTLPAAHAAGLVPEFPPAVAVQAPAAFAPAMRQTGLAHPVFGARSSAQAAAVARRAVLLREILGPPLALRR